MDAILRGETSYEVIKVKDGQNRNEPELYKKIIDHNKVALKLQEARTMTLVAKIRERGLAENTEIDAKYPDVLSEQGELELLCEALEHQCADMKEEIKQYLKEKKEREERERRKKEKREDAQDGVQEEAQDEEVYQYETFEEDWCENAKFDREDFLKNNAEAIIKNLEGNNQIDKERKEHELDNLRKALEYNEDDYTRRIPELLNQRAQQYPEGSSNYKLFKDMLLNFTEIMKKKCSLKEMSQMYSIAKSTNMEDISKAFYDQSDPER